MSLRNKLIGAGMTAALLSAFSLTALAQEPQGPPTDRGSRPERMGRRAGKEGKERMRGREMGQHLFRALDLTDAQKEQLRAAGQQHREGTRAQREELRQLAEKRRQGSLTASEEARARALREEIRTSMRNSHTNLLSILTAEQKAKLEELRKERRERSKEMRERHKEKGEKPPVKPGDIQ
jgi:protein CpxP